MDEAGSRLTCDEETDLDNNVPLLGVSKAPDMSLEEALEYGKAASELEGDYLRACLKSARRKIWQVQQQGPDPLNEDEIGAIYMYTMESPLYHNLNFLLRAPQRDSLRPLFPYLKLLLTALHKLPPIPTDTFFRGVKCDLSHRYDVQSEVTWWGFTSTTATQGVINRFLGKSGPRTMFTIKTSRAVDVCKYSALVEEDERLLLPGLQLKVKSKFVPSDDLVMIQLDELADQYLLPGFSFGALSPSSRMTLLYSPTKSKEDEKVLRYRLRAEAGDAEAMYSLGMCYATGDGTPKDEEESKKWFRKVVEAGDGATQRRRSACYDRDLQVAHDSIGAARWCRMAADTGLAEAQRNLGLMFKKGRGVRKDEVEAVKWYQKAAEAGSTKAQYSLAICYDRGQGAEQDSAEAARWCRMAADAGLAEAQRNLGFLLKNGRGVRKDEVEAVEWYRRAAEAGDVRAQYNLSVCCYNGQGVEQDFQEAARWCRMAAEAGLAHAQCNLGFMYENGCGVPKDKAEAVKWYQKAALAGHKVALQLMGKYIAV